MIHLPSIPVMRRAFAEKDPAYDGTFFVAVKTTSIFCRPVCRAKPPKPENVEFFPSAKDALYHGYRACKLCRPLDSGAKPPEVVQRLMDLLETALSERMTGERLRSLGIDPATARRQFKAYCGMTFAAYQRARRMGAALREVRGGTSVTLAQAGAGFRSESGFREAFANLFGTPASRAEGVAMLSAQWIPSPLGPIVAVANDEGLVLVDFIDRKGLEGALERVRRRCGKRRAPAVIAPAPHRHLDALTRELTEYFAGKRQDFSVPLAPNGSDFQMRAWQYLRAIPFGQTRSYGEQARAIGARHAVRAVGTANGMNYLSIVIPCHRVIGAAGALTGYGGGLARKRWLLDHEQRIAKQL